MKDKLKLMGNVISALSILFVLLALRRIDFDMEAVADWPVFLFVCLAGIIIKIITVLLSGSAWCQWLECFADKRCSRREALRVYARANIGKYLPGNVMHYVERNLFAENLRLSQKQIAAASLAEVFSLILAAVMTGVLLAYPQMREAAGAVMEQEEAVQKLQPFVWVCCTAIGMLAVAAVLFLVYRKRHSFISTFLSTFIRCLLIYAWVLMLLGFLFVILYWYWAGRPSYGQALQMIAAYSAAWVSGFVIPGAPGGIGVRELVLTLLLSSAAGQDTIAVLSVLHRLITVCGDFAAYLLRRFF